MKFDSTIFGGLPVIVTARIEGPDRESGIPYRYAEIDAIEVSRALKRTRRVVRRAIPRSWWEKARGSGDLDRLADEALEQV